MTDYALVLTRRYAGKFWTLEGDNYDGLTWLSKGKAPTQDELDAQWDEVQKEIKDEQIAKAKARQTILDRLGITNEELLAILS